MKLSQYSMMDPEFSRRGCESKRRRAPTYYLANFPRMLHGNWDKTMGRRPKSANGMDTTPCLEFMSGDHEASALTIVSR